MKRAERPNTTGRDIPDGAILCAVGALGLTFAAMAIRRPKRRLPWRSFDKQAAFTSYLQDHLAGADTAIQMVEHLSDGHRGTEEGKLFAWLYEQFREDRAVVEALVATQDASPVSIKRLAGLTAGTALRAVGGGDPGDVSLFRTLEALAIGVQGKRCLWRAAQSLSPLRAPGRRSFIELEEDAVRQWRAIERCRRSLVPRTFAS